MRKVHLGWGLSAAAVLAIPVIGAFAAAPAEAATTIVQRCPTKWFPGQACTIRFSRSGAGTVTVGVDKPGTSSIAYTWTLSANGRPVCRGTYRPADPPRSWSCWNVPAGAEVFTTPADNGPTSVRIIF